MSAPSGVNNGSVNVILIGSEQRFVLVSKKCSVGLFK